MDIEKAAIKVIGQPESVILEYKAVLPPATTLARLIASFANTEGGFIVLGVAEDGNDLRFNGLSEEFHAVPITHKAVDLLAPRPTVNYQYVLRDGKRLFAIKVEKSAAPVALGVQEFVRVGATSQLKRAEAQKRIRHPKLEQLSLTLEGQRRSCTGAKAKLLDHYQSVLNILDDLRSLLYPESWDKPTTILEGSVLMRILFSSCADNFETYLSDLLYEIYLAKPETLKSAATVSVRDVLECPDMQEFISVYAKKKLSKLQRGSVKGFIAENKQISGLRVFNDASEEEIEKILQIRHLYSHRNGIIDEKFQGYFPHATLNAEHQMSLDQFLTKFEYLAWIIDLVDQAALAKYQLASLG